MASATMSFQFPKDKVDEIKDRAQKEHRGVSGFIQKILTDYVKKEKK